jgi:hypothetical protein
VAPRVPKSHQTVQLGCPVCTRGSFGLAQRPNRALARAGACYARLEHVHQKSVSKCVGVNTGLTVAFSVISSNLSGRVILCWVIGSAGAKDHLNRIKRSRSSPSGSHLCELVVIIHLHTTHNALCALQTDILGVTSSAGAGSRQHVCTRCMVAMWRSSDNDQIYF